jgi:hypothetical protein
VVYARELDGKAHDFGVIGVETGTLILYDQQTRSRWSQLLGHAVSGPLQGKKLEKLPSTMTTWKKWKTLHPDTTVYVKRSIPYQRRFTQETFEQIARMEEGPAQTHDLVVGLEGHVEARAYLLRRLAKARLVEDSLEGSPIMVYLSEDLATARVYRRTVGERALSFSRATGDLLHDRETGSSWDAIHGKAVAGPLEGEELQPLVSTYSLWFAWKKYRPDTHLHDGGS